MNNFFFVSKILYYLILYFNKVHRVVNDDFYNQFKGAVARNFCAIYQDHLRPWKIIDDPILQNFDKVSLNIERFQLKKKKLISTTKNFRFY